MPTRCKWAFYGLSLFLVVVASGCPMFSYTPGSTLPGEGPRLGKKHLTQDQIASGNIPLQWIRLDGRRIFSTPFNKRDGYGDGPESASEDPTILGGRPTLQNNGTFLRVNGLDGQMCVECHFILSHRSIPIRFGIGGAGGSVTNALFRPTEIDVADNANAGFASFDGRFINPPSLFGTGGVQLVANDMTMRLQQLKAQAKNQPGTPVHLVAKGVDFGTITYTGGAFDTSDVHGIASDLVVRPFGRKGEFATVRQFDLDAMQFHLGMQPTEVVGANVDADHDGVANEVNPGEISALDIYITTLERPDAVASPDTQAGFTLFKQIGCADCHVPAMTTTSRFLTFSFPEVQTDPTANVYYRTDLTKAPTGFAPAGNGIRVPMFSDLKRHDMGPALAESFGSPLDSEFLTARLWGVADTAPYLHDGRALTLGDAIMLHGGEAAASRDAYTALADADKAQVLHFLLSLRSPSSVGGDLDKLSAQLNPAGQ